MNNTDSILEAEEDRKEGRREREEGGRRGKEGRKGEFQGKRRMCVQNERRQEKCRVLGTPGLSAELQLRLSWSPLERGQDRRSCLRGERGSKCAREDGRKQAGRGGNSADEELQVRADSTLVCLDIKGREMLS